MISNPFVARQEGGCSSGTTFYSCVANSFRGCCSKDPCALISCPDKFGLMKDPKDDGSGDDDQTTSTPESDEAPPTPTDGGQKQQTQSTSSPVTTKKSTTMTDSGITHTIPNNSIVTITRHTTITTGRSATTASGLVDLASSTSVATVTGTESATSDGIPTPSPTSADGATSPSESSETGPLSLGAIVGIAIGGVALVAVIVVLVLTLMRRKKHRGSDTDSVFRQGNRQDDVVEEKHFPHPISAHTAGSQGSSDPFAPFGGRADQPEDPYRPASGAFEMDGSSAVPVELPAVSFSSPSTNRQKTASRLGPVQEVIPTDPRANLTPVPTDDGKPVYVNHWNQYKNLG
ncbi:hypothetical protein TARUN_2679 [Trichoderma arundinaceum]|uniref:Uncharacterized protein n=1 Tax=Trichoderma arundinaceum TaxID=490622 RepID=A0A395NTW3_TRIAR|nr:hypothetical protein TARUN_2679 [Trichoderma arundinaceum]